VGIEAQTIQIRSSVEPQRMSGSVRSSREVSESCFRLVSCGWRV
jgi:hypothetical protein